MKYDNLVAGWKRFGFTPEDVCYHSLGVPVDVVHERVIIAPWWEPVVFNNLGESTFLSKSYDCSIKVWEIQSDHCNYTYIRTGIGAPVLTDAILSLAGTKCKDILFVGSVGSLSNTISIGDIVIPEVSICGDGMSRYLRDVPLRDGDSFGDKSYPDAQLVVNLSKNTERICKLHDIAFHFGTVFSIDTIVAQFSYIDEIMGMGCNVIEMETAAAFRAAAIIGKKIAALLSVSDNTIQSKSLVVGITENEIAHRKDVRRKIFPQIIKDTFF